MAELDVDAFLKELEKDTRSNSGDSLVKLIMNTPDNQGSVTILPFISDALKGAYGKIVGVKEFYGTTSLIDSGEGWMRILPKDFYGTLTEEQTKLYDQCNSVFDALSNYVSYHELRVRTYTLITGILLSQKKTDGSSVTDNVGKPVVLIYPSAAPLKSINDAIKLKLEATQGRKDWIPRIINNQITGRTGVLQLSFKKSDGPGYASSAAFVLNSEYDKVVDQDRSFPASTVEQINRAYIRFQGWQYDYDNNSPFHTVMFKELLEQMNERLKLEVKNAANTEKKVEEEAKTEVAAQTTTPPPTTPF